MIYPTPTPFFWKIILVVYGWFQTFWNFANQKDSFLRGEVKKLSNCTDMVAEILFDLWFNGKKRFLAGRLYFT